jgi:hypothetical protein
MSTFGFTPKLERRYSACVVESYLHHREGFVTRKSAGILSAALLLASMLTASPLFAQSNSDQSGMPKVGDMAPDFTLKYFDGTDRKDVKLSDYRGKKNVVLAFFVFAFTGG